MSRKWLLWSPRPVQSWLRWWTTQFRVWTSSPCEHIHTAHVYAHTQCMQSLQRGLVLSINTYRRTQTCTKVLLHSRPAKFLFFFFFFFFNSASRSEPKRVQSAECLKKWTWHLLNQIEIKIVKHKPNLRNLPLAFAQRFVPLEGYSVFHRQLSTASHTHTHAQ